MTVVIIWILSFAIIVLFIFVVILTLDLRAKAAKLKRYKRIFSMSEDVVGVGTWYLDLSSNSVEWSPFVYHIHGRKEQKGPPKLLNAVHYYHPEDRAMVGNKIEQSIATGEDFSFRARIIGEDSIERKVVSKGTCHKDSSGEVIGLYGVFFDLNRDLIPAKYV